MKKIWIGLKKWNKEIIDSAINNGIDALILPKGHYKYISNTRKTTIVAQDGNLIPEIDVKFFTISSSKQIEEALNLANNCIVILKLKNWKIIPLENIISKKIKNIIIHVKNANEALTVFNVLEKGIIGIYIDIKNIYNFKNFLSTILNFKKTISLKVATVESIEQIGIGYRVCIDTCSVLNYGDGLLVGSSSNFFFLIHAENIDNLYIPKRPFRINVGSVHSYIISTNSRTNYLSEIESGHKINIVNYRGNIKKAIVGRTKIEKRPLCLLRVMCDGYVGTIILQNAETIRLVSKNGNPKSILNILPGDEILVHITKGARHFGNKIEEFISEK